MVQFRPKITIITVCKNSASTINKTIQSVVNQSYRNFEYIIIDGGSQDNTLEIIRNYSCNIKYLISEKDNGIYDAMNKGIRLATGDIIGILNSDDQYFLDTLSMVAQNYDPQKILAGYCLRPDGTNNQLINKSGSRFQKKHSLRKLIYGMALDHPSMFVPNSIYKKHGLYDTNYSICADYKWTVTAWINGYSIDIIDYPLTIFSFGGISDMNRIQTSLEIYRIQNELNLLPKYKALIYLLYKLILRFTPISFMYYLKR